MYIRRVLSAFIPLLVACSNGSAGDGDGGQRGEWESFDGTRFPYTKWLPADGARPLAVVVCVHGISGAASDFEQLGDKLSRHGMAVYAHELRGQGHDPRRRRVGDIRRRKHWSRDLDIFLEHARRGHGEVPVFLYGESLGSLILMHGFAELSAGNREAVAGLVFASPVVSLPMDLPPLRNFFLHLAVRVLPCVRVSLEKLSGGGAMQVTDGGDHWEQMEKTPHSVRRYSLRMLGIVERMVGGCATAAARIRKPVLVLCPGRDVFTTPAQVEAFYAGLGTPDKSKQLFADSHHLLHYDKEREDVFERVRGWVEERS